MFQDAVDALQRGDKTRAKELLTLLLKADQNNATYWVWFSATVDNTKGADLLPANRVQTRP